MSTRTDLADALFKLKDNPHVCGYSWESAVLIEKMICEKIKEHMAACHPYLWTSHDGSTWRIDPINVDPLIGMTVDGTIDRSFHDGASYRITLDAGDVLELHRRLKKRGYKIVKDEPAENDKIAIEKSAAKDIIRWLENVDERMSPTGIINYLKLRLEPKAKAA